MKTISNIGNALIKSLSIFDFALIKICLVSLGVFLGTLCKGENKKSISAVALISFIGTYVIIMPKMISQIAQYFSEGK